MLPGFPLRSERHPPARLRSATALAVSLLLTACATTPAPGPGARPDGDAAPAWAGVITPDDQDRLRRLPEAWTTALAQAREAGHGAELAALGALADPGATLVDPMPPPGRYRCRTIKIGAQGDLLDYIAYSWFVCEVSADPHGMLHIDKRTGSQRQHGVLYPDTDRRMVFLGTLALGSDEAAGPAYGATADRDVVGVMERVAPDRWRLVQPWPRFESNLDLMELQPL